jgi:hypothetical protein
MQTKLERLKTVFTHKYWLVVALSGAFFSFFALNRGGVVVFIDATFIFLVLNIATGRYRLKTIPTSYWVTCMVCAYVLFISILVAPHDSHYRWMRNVPRMLALVFGMHCLFQRKIDTRITVFFGITVSVAVCWQFAVLHFFGRPAGTFEGIHKLAIFAVLVIPFIFYYCWITNGWYRYLWVAVGLIAIDLLLQTGSRPAFLGIISGTVFVTIFLVKSRYKWFGLAAITLILVALFVTNYANFASRIKEFIELWHEEQRIQMWATSWHTLGDNSFLDWIFGHGIGYFEVPYPGPLKTERIHVSPHNYFLHLLYTSGVIGFILVTVGFSILIGLLFRSARRSQEIKMRVLSRCLIVNFFSWLTLCGLNFSFYSKYSLYPLAFVLGPMLVVGQHNIGAHKSN